MFDATSIFEAVCALIAAIITVAIIPYIRSKVSAQKLAEISIWVKTAVTAAEQIFAGSGRGEEKKDYVLSWLAERGINIDEDKVDAMIESAVYALKNNTLSA